MFELQLRHNHKYLAEWHSCKVSHITKVGQNQIYMGCIYCFLAGTSPNI